PFSSWMRVRRWVFAALGSTISPPVNACTRTGWARTAQKTDAPSFWATPLFFSFSGLSAAAEVVMFTNRSNYQPDRRQRQRLIEGHRNKAPI
ncbi:MAG TPA: hypothetical protein VD840_13930, partial [Sinorhizobium sp.]|nr:hypothetical protein [Sinorhizobium sp.]